jgi:hypothetical protein
LEAPLPGSGNAIAILRWAYLATILVLTAVGFVVGPQMEPSLEGGLRYLVSAIAFMVAIVTLLLTLNLVLPAMARQPATPPPAIATIAYSFAEAPAIFGIVLALITGEGWLALPFGGVAIVAWLAMDNFVKGLLASQPEEFTRL